MTMIAQKTATQKTELHRDDSFAKVKQEVIEMFSDDAQLWIKTYQGTLNNIHEMQLILAFNGSVCKGKYFYPSSGIGFMIEGQETTTGLELMEIDHDENISAYIVLKNDQGLLQGTWNHIEQDISIPINLSEVNKLTKQASPCAKGSWQRIYKGQLDGSNISIKLQKESNVDALEALLEIDGIPFPFTADCPSQECNSFLYDFSEISSLYNTLSFRVSTDETIHLTAALKDGAESQVDLALDHEMQFECLNFVDYTTRFDLIYPIMQNESFDKWINYKIQDWKDRINGEIKHRKIQNPGEVPSDRFIYEAVGWVDILYFSENIVSGILTFQKSWSAESERVSFNYMIKKKKHLDVSDFFNSDFEYENFIEGFVADQKKNYLPFQEPILRNWIAEQDFSYINLTDKGITLSTDFHTVFGAQQILLSYMDLKGHLKKNVSKEFLR